MLSKVCARPWWWWRVVERPTLVPQSRPWPSSSQPPKTKPAAALTPATGTYDKRDLHSNLMIIKACNPRYARILQAAADGDLGILREEGELSLQLEHVRCSSGCTVLHYAAGNNQLHVMDYLLQVYVGGFIVDIPATGRKARGRTPLHYACRNGHLQAVRRLVQDYHADANARAKHGVTPLQLAVWRNHLDVCQYLVDDCGVDAGQTNDFDCGLVHWLASAPSSCAGPDGRDLIETANWLSQLPGIDFFTRQRQGHSVLHKAAWLGHLEVVQYLHVQHDLWDDVAEHGGNFAADLADMAHTPKHAIVARYLRENCSRQRAESCRILGISLEDACDLAAVHGAYRNKAKKLHPDRIDASMTTTDKFHVVAKAYHHLTKEHGHGSQANPAHSLKLMLQFTGQSKDEFKTDDDGTDSQLQDTADCFKARLMAVLLEYGTQGLDLSNVKKKWTQVWPDTPFPKPLNGKPMALSDYIVEHAGDVVTLRSDERGCLCVHAKTLHQGPATM